jgi:hypothetical protein
VSLKDCSHLCAISLNFFTLTPFHHNSIHFSPSSHVTCGPNQLRGPKYPCLVPLLYYRPARRQFRSARSTLRTSTAAAKEHAVSSSSLRGGGGGAPGRPPSQCAAVEALASELACGDGKGPSKHARPYRQAVGSGADLQLHLLSASVHPPLEV